MTTWNRVRKQIYSVSLTHASWYSDRKHLLEIIDVAEMLNIVAPRTSISNLRTIVKPARAAIKDHKTKKLAELFRMAEVFPTAYLRVKCGRRLQPVCCCEVTAGEKIKVQIDLTQEQFSKFACTMKNRFEFQMS